ncbi:hypothetical protein C8A05DRAFT_42300 [Staphylotrichum tortipilum]|uniref:Uncharacterized protein n=1 Tax=Staphylotrichum tortipilum TaxID=2831512 RepID=A0AAN6MQF2_9PEZI|nr:hypothetical protein C8A05DRAFT_42300 [Staphylotrichum longicolle]
MAPASKRALHADGVESVREPDAGSALQNSITVAAETSAAPASRAGSEPGSAHCSPERMAQGFHDLSKSGISGGAGRGARDSGETGIDKGHGNGHIMPASAAPPSARDHYHEYEFSDLDEITVRQLNEDILAYRYDLDYCKAQLEEVELTPQETRTLQLRTLDLGHQIRHCTHRIETIKAQTRKHSFRPQHYGTVASNASQTNKPNGSSKRPHNLNSNYGIGMVAVGHTTSSQTAGADKRPAPDDGYGSAKRPKLASPDFEGLGGGSEDGVTTLQRLGFWKCRLCSAPKYLLAGAGRSPAAPCKWPLKDISKMITHFTEMHSEHTPNERCVELGAALTQNRGPFEYWLRRTRSQNISDGSIIEDCLAILLGGGMPDLLRRHSRAAAGMLVH